MEKPTQDEKIEFLKSKGINRPECMVTNASIQSFMTQLGGAHLMANFVSHGSAAPLLAQLNGPFGCNSLSISEYILYEN